MSKKKKLKQFKKKKIQKEPAWAQALHCVLFSVVPILCFYMMEFYDRNPFEQIRYKAHFFNIFLFELIAWILWLLVGKARAALRIIAFLSCITGLANHYVMEFRSTPFVPWDFFSIGTAASVAGDYDFTPTLRVAGITAGFLLLIILLQLMKFSFPAKLPWRLIGVPVLGTVLVLFAGRLQDESFQTANYLYPYLFTPGVMVKYDGFAVTFTMDLAYLKIDRPSGYSKSEAEEILASYEEDTLENTADDSDGTDKGSVNEETGSEDLPNIIVIMDEAFSDLSVLGDFETNEDYMPFVHSLQQGAENTITGYLNVSVCGGNTADTEFEFLTGNTMAFLPSGSIPYQQYIRSETPSLASWLKSLGYATYAQHPYYASGWNREKVYPLLGFDDLSFLPDYSQPEKIRSYVSDASDFDYIISTYENKEEGKPAFIFNVTMQNHGGYTDTYSDSWNCVEAEGMENDALNQYLSLIRLTDQDLEQLIDYFSQEDEKTILVFFGDHQPNNTCAYSILSKNGMDYNNLTDDETELRYQVPYVIWANFDIEEERGADTSANYLAEHVLKAAGVPLSGYQKFLSELEEEYPIISAVRTEEASETKTSETETSETKTSETETSVTETSETETSETETSEIKSSGESAMQENSTGEDLLNIYQKLQYYLMFD